MDSITFSSEVQSSTSAKLGAFHVDVHIFSFCRKFFLE